MFPKLPYEIILNISSHLKFEDKLNLKLTCLKINNIITNAVLYYDLNLLDSKYTKGRKDDNKRGDVIIQRLINAQFDGSLVRVLHIDIYLLSFPMISQLPELFPNVTRLIYSTAERSGYPSDYLGRLQFNNQITDPMIKWRNTIQFIDSRYDWYWMKRDIMRSKYPRLTELDLSGVANVLKLCVGEGSFSFFCNAPLLTTLTLRNANMNLEILEALHTGFSRLKSLKLIDSSIENKKDTILPHFIEPASSMSYLGLYDLIAFNKDSVVLEYIVKKYTSLQQLVYNVKRDADYSIKTRREFEKESGESDETFENKVVTEIAQSEATFPIYSAIESTFFSRFPKSIKTLTLELNNMDKAVAALAEADTSITVLNLRGRNERCYRWTDGSWKPTILVGSSILSQLKKLGSLKTLKMSLDSSAQVYAPTFISATVTRLFVGLQGDVFYIEWILSMFPALDELYINTAECDTINITESDIRGQNDDRNRPGEESQPKKKYPKLQKITIKERSVHPSFFDFMKTSAPNLDELNLDIRFPNSSDKISYSYDLSNWCLNKCNLSFSSSRLSSTIYCVISIQNISKSLRIDPHDKVLLPANRQYKYKPDKLWVQVKSDQIQHLKIFGYSLVKVGEDILIGV